MARVRKKNKMTKQATLKLADKMWRIAIVREHGDRCELCGAVAVDCHHIYFKSSYPFLRFDISNGIPLCRHCHHILHNENRELIENKIIAQRGKEWHEKLLQKAYQGKLAGTATIFYYKKVIEELK